MNFHCRTGCGDRPAWWTWGWHWCVGAGSWWIAPMVSDPACPLCRGVNSANCSRCKG